MVERWLCIGVTLDAKKFIAVERNDEITFVIGLYELYCLADDVTFSFKVFATVILKRNIDALFLAILRIFCVLRHVDPLSKI